MRFIADVNVPLMLVNRLRENGCDVSCVRDENPMASDDSILAQAQFDKRTIITFDKDFGELAFRDQRGSDYGIALIRVPMAELDAQLDALALVLANHATWVGNFTVIEPTRLRIKRLPTTADDPKEKS